MTLKGKVIEVIRKNSENLESVSSDADLVKEVGIDSFGMIMIVNAIEDAFSISVEEEDITTIRTVDDITHLLRTKYGIKD
jgi:acyl carrier protein